MKFHNIFHKNQDLTLDAGHEVNKCDIVLLIVNISENSDSKYIENDR